MSIPYEDLVERLTYHPETGLFTYNYFCAGMQAGSIAGSNSGKDYLEVTIKGNKERLHRLAWLYMTGDYPPRGIDVDHIDTIRSHNWWDNLRLATRSQNSCNSVRQLYTKTGIKGISICSRSGKYRVSLKLNGVSKSFGYYVVLEDAIKAIELARQKLHKQFTNHG
jgi:hypothetical protein